MARRVSQKALRRMKSAQQMRDRELVAKGAVPPEAMLFLRPERLKGVRITWPRGPLTDEKSPAERSRARSAKARSPNKQRG